MSGRDSRDLPVTLDWYRQAAYWIVGLSTAVLGAGAVYLKDHPAGSHFAKTTALLAGIGFLGATITGLSFYFYLTKYANQFELYITRERKLDLVTDPHEWLIKKKKLDEVRKEREKAHKGYSWCYPSMLSFFGAGALLMALSAFKELQTPAKRQSTNVVVDLTDSTITRIGRREELRNLLRQSLSKDSQPGPPAQCQKGQRGSPETH